MSSGKNERVAPRGGSSTATPAKDVATPRDPRVVQLARDLFIARFGERAGFRVEAVADETFKAAVEFWRVADSKAESN